jgi:hypothetical protein
MGFSKLKAESERLKAFCRICLGAWFFCLGSMGFAHAQTFAEWFSQGKTQIKYLTQQIAALNALRVSGEQGYTMLKNEWGAIGNWKNGEFGLHQAYYASLGAVSPVVKANVSVSDLASQQQSMVTLFAGLPKLPGLSSGDLVYIAGVREKVIAAYDHDLAELQKVLQSNVLVMSDDERLKRVKTLILELQDQYEFTCSFSAEVRLLSVQRVREQNEVQTLNGVYGNN